MKVTITVAIEGEEPIVFYGDEVDVSVQADILDVGLTPNGFVLREPTGAQHLYLRAHRSPDFTP